jgi:hypothetical protein
MAILDPRWLGAAALLLILIATWVAWYPAAREAWPLWRRRSLTLRAATALALLAAFALLLRPHEDTFAGLDASGYRHMASAFRAGRGLHDPDTTLLRAPLEIRNAFLLLSDMNYRNTRDRSFQILSLSRAETEPFFYPLVPLAAAAFDRLMPGGRDYLLPLLHAGMIGVLLLIAAARGGGVGLLAGGALLLGSPIPAWFLRGYYPESLGALLVAGAILQANGGRPARIGAAFALGMALSLHPMLLVIVVPAFGLLVLSSGGLARSLLGLAAGGAPLFAMTEYICRPYGNIFKIETLRFNASVSGEHRVVIAFAVLAAAALGAAWIALRAARGNLWERIVSRCGSARGRILLAALAFLPFSVACLLPDVGPTTLQGAREAWRGVRIPLGMLISIMLFAAFARLDARRLFALVVALAAMPVFFYLKGEEVAGLWHQRRILPGFLLLVATLMPSVSAVESLLARAGAARRAMSAVFVLAAFAALLANPIRWPAPYIVRNESGAQAWFDAIARETGDALTLFDYHSYSFPLAVDLNRPVLGLCERESARAFLPKVIQWIASESRTQEVRVAAAFANPGMEENLCLLPGPIVSAEVMRIRSKGMLPAVAEPRVLSVELLTARPAEEHEPRLHKVFDGGPLAARGPWVTRVQSLRSAAGETVPAQWFRTGAGVIGPVAREGERLIITVYGATGRRDRAARQRIDILDEAGAALGSIELGHSWTEARLEIPGRAAPAARTALYRLITPTPYNPADEGLRGYHPDLGALVHRIDMEIVSAHTRPDA